MVLFRYSFGVLYSCIWVLTGCSGSAQESTSVVVSGQIHSEMGGEALVAATACVGTATPCFTVDANGTYTIPFEHVPTSPLILNVSAPGYARRSIRLRPTSAPQALITLRKADQVTTLALPSGTDADAVVAVTRNDATTNLSIPADSLALPNGQLAAGNANVSLTFWHPMQAHLSMPANLLAQNGNTSKALETYGMIDIEVEQNGALLQVMPGKNLLWSVIEPPAVAETLILSPNMTIPMAVPNLYSVDTESGLWKLEGSVSTNAVSWDANTKTISSLLPHLSGWNIDQDAGPQYGGCVTGRLMNSCGQPDANAAFTLWFLGFEDLKDWSGNKTDSNGHYCIDTYMSSFNVTSGNRSTPYFISTATTPPQTKMCNPVPFSSCFNCVDEGGEYGSIGWCSNCVLADINGNYLTSNVGVDPFLVYVNTCNAPILTLVPYTSCAANNCVVLPDVQLPGSTCTSNPCANDGGKKEGQACTAADTCCPTATLVCADNLCVPSVDPTITTQ